MSSAGGWSSLQKDVLDLISNRLTFDPDHIRFRSVCAQWRSSSPKRPQLPWLLCHRKDDQGIYSIFNFFKLSSNRDRILQIRDLPNFSIPNGFIFIGSSRGWMILTDIVSRSIVLFNPFTRSTTHLPALPSFSDSSRCVFFRAALSPDRVALAVCCCHREFSFCRAGDDAWTRLRGPKLEVRNSQACFFRGRFYVASYDSVYGFDLGGNPSIQFVASVNVESERFSEIRCESHLVESDGDLLLVLGYFFHPEGYRFRVFKLEWGERVELVKLESLGDRTLFVKQGPQANGSSVCVSQVPGCRGNNVYYTWTDYGERGQESTRLNVRDLEDGNEVFVGDDASLSDGHWKPCAWFTPNLLQ